MDINQAKELCEEHNVLLETINLIKEADKNKHWIMIQTPKGQSILSNMQIKSVLVDAEKRSNEIEKFIQNR